MAEGRRDQTPTFHDACRSVAEVRRTQTRPHAVVPATDLRCWSIYSRHVENAKVAVRSAVPGALDADVEEVAVAVVGIDDAHGPRAAEELDAVHLVAGPGLPPPPWPDAVAASHLESPS